MAIDWLKHRLRPPSLRGRIRWALVGFGGIAALLLALGAMFIDEALEHMVIQDTLRAEASRVMATLKTPHPSHFDTAVMQHYFWSDPGEDARDDDDIRLKPGTADSYAPVAPSLYVPAHGYRRDFMDGSLWQGVTAPSTLSSRSSPRRTFNWSLQQGLKGYLWRSRVSQDTPPPALRHLKSGFHEAVRLDGRDYYVLVRNGPDGRYYIAYDTTRLHRRERWFVGALIFAVALILYSADRLGRHTANQLTRPLTELSAAVRTIDPARRHTRIPAERGDPELSDIASAFNAFLARMDEFVEREQAFTRTASHELRTPLAVISGAAEVIAARSDTQDPAAAPLRRIRRATREMSETVEALLALARADGDADAGSCRVDRLAAEIVADHAYLTEDRDMRLEMEECKPTEVSAHPRMVSILISNLVRNAVQNTSRGRVTVAVDGQALRVEDTGHGLDPALAERFFKGEGVRMRTDLRGHGLGLYIVGQICNRYGWPIQINANTHGGTVVLVRMKRETAASSAA